MAEIRLKYQITACVGCSFIRLAARSENSLLVLANCEETAKKPRLLQIKIS